ncbi:MAG: ABC transporter ATP-binding protein [Thermoguttaceae bacterium]|jgi:ABC-type nitrate/sulfonate/bicarbonate transport system ATPase subunit
MPKIELNDVSKAYGATQVLRNLSLHVEDREFVVLLGPSGSGKSTCLRLIAGLERPDSGNVKMDGRDITSPSRDRGLVFQHYTNFPWLTVARNVEYPLRIAGTSRAESRLKGEDWLRTVGLTEFASFYPAELSGGMQQRLALARTLAANPQVLLMDEPLGALDAVTRDSLQEQVLRLWAETGKTIVFVTHDIHEAVFLADRIYVFSKRPAKVAGEFVIRLPRPRDQNIKFGQRFAELAARAAELLVKQS